MSMTMRQTLADRLLQEARILLGASAFRPGEPGVIATPRHGQDIAELGNGELCRVGADERVSHRSSPEQIPIAFLRMSRSCWSR